MKRFVCECCGACCKWPGYVRFSEEELERMARFLNLDLGEFINRYTELAPERTHLILSTKSDGACIFLTEDNLCQVNPVKPQQCASFPYDWNVPEVYRKLCKGHWEENGRENRTGIQKIWVLGHPDLPLDMEAYPENAQIFNGYNFCHLLAFLGIPFTYIGVPGSKVPEGGEFLSSGEPLGQWRYDSPWHTEYTKRLNALIGRELNHFKGKGIFASLYGAAQSGADYRGFPVIEPMVGYDHCWAPYRVFPSYSQQSVIYATRVQETWNTRFFDAVIPHFVRSSEYPFTPNPQNYLLYLGREAADKGIELAKEIASSAGLELKMVHRGVWGKKKAELLGGARAVLMPTLYLEPFGYVAIEAMMCGTPVITTDWGAFPEIITQGVTGFRCRRAAEFARAVELAPTLKREDIRRAAISKYSLIAVAPLFERVLRSVLNIHENGGYYAPEIKEP